MNNDNTLIYRHVRRNIGICLLLFILLFMLVFSHNRSEHVKAQSIQASFGMQRIPGHLVPVLQHAQPLGLTDPDQQLNLSISLKLRNQPELDALLLAQSDPKSPQYHHYLTLQAFTAQFSPTQAAVNSVVSYLHQEHFSVLSITPNRLIVNVIGKVATVQRAFQTELDNYRVKSRVVYAPVLDPMLPTPLLQSVQLIGGLNNVVHFYPVVNRIKHNPMYRRLDPTSGFTPNEIRTAYNVQPLLTAGADGTGQTIGIVELAGYNAADINTYLQHYQGRTPLSGEREGRET